MTLDFTTGADFMWALHEHWAKRIRDFLGRPLDVEKMAGVVDSNLYRNRA